MMMTLNDKSLAPTLHSLLETNDKSA